MCSMYENIDDEAFIGSKQYSVIMFKVNFLGLGLLSSFFSSFFFLIYIHITFGFWLMTHIPVGLRALGVETPLQA